MLSQKNTERIRILVICGSLGVGGAEVQAAKLLPLLDRQKFDVEVVYYNKETGHPKDQLLSQGIPVHYLGNDKWDRWQFMKKLTNFIRQGKFDIVHAWMASANHYARLPALWARVPVIIGGLQGQIELQKNWSVLYSFMNLACSGWIVNSQTLKEFVKNELFFMHGTPVWVVKNGLEVGGENLFRQKELTEYDAIRENRPVVGIVGRLHPVKNHRLFLDMALELTSAGVDADYWIIGDGPMRSDIEHAVAEMGLSTRVKLLGLRQDVNVALCRMDVLVLTSDSESCPNAVLEAMRAGLPVVATNCTDFNNIIEEGDNGFIVPIREKILLTQRVAHILATPTLRETMGAKSRAIIDSRFSLNAAVNSLADAYLAAVNSAAHSSKQLREKLRS